MILLFKSSRWGRGRHWKYPPCLRRVTACFNRIVLVVSTETSNFLFKMSTTVLSSTHAEISKQDMVNVNLHIWVGFNSIINLGIFLNKHTLPTRLSRIMATAFPSFPRFRWREEEKEGKGAEEWGGRGGEGEIVERWDSVTSPSIPSSSLDPPGDKFIHQSNVKISAVFWNKFQQFLWWVAREYSLASC